MIFKRLVLLFGIFVFAVCTFVIFALVLVNPRDFDVDLAGWISEQTGRQVRIAGGLKFELFPWLGVRVRDLVVEQPEGFGREPFLSVGEARLRVRLLPLLLRQEVELDRVEVSDPSFLLLRDQAGRTNWEDLLQHLPLADAGESAAAMPRLQVQGRKDPLLVHPFDWQGLALEQGQVEYRDATTGEQLRVKNLQIRADPGLDFGYHASCGVSSDKHDLEAELVLHGSCRLTQAPLNLLLQDTALNVEVALTRDGETRHGAFSGTADFDLMKQSFRLGQASLLFDGLRVGGELAGQRVLQDDFVVNGELSLLESSPEILLGEDVSPELHAFLANLGVTTSFTASPQAVSFQELRVISPSVALQGSAELALVPEPAVSLELEGESLDLDALVPSKAEATTESVLPEWLLFWPEDLPPVHLNCALRRFKGFDVAAKGLKLQARTAPGAVQIALDAQSFLEGSLSANCSVQKGDVYVKASLGGGSADALNVLLFGAPHMQGTLSLEAEASSKGGTASSLWRNLRLQADLTLEQGALDFTTPPKVLGASPQPSFRFQKCVAKMAMSNAEQNAPQERLPFTYSLQTVFTELNPEGIFTEPVKGKRYAGNASGELTLRGTALVDARSPDFLGLENTLATLRYSGPGTDLWPEQRWEFQGQGKGRVDMASDVMGISGINGTLSGTRVQGSLSIENVFKPGKPSRYSGSLVAPAFAPRRVLPLFGLIPPVTKEGYALEQGSLDATYAIDDKEMDVELLQLTLDRSSILGKITLSGLDREGPPLYLFDLAMDELELDAYLPPEEKGTDVPPAKWSGEWLEELELAGTLTLDSLKAFDLRYDEVRATIEAKNGGMWIRPVSSRFYGGEFFGEMSLHTLPRREGLGVSATCSIADFQLEEVVADFGGGDVVGGLASWDMNLSGGGRNMRSMLQSTNGKARFGVENGYYTFQGNGKSRAPKSRGTTLPGKRSKREPEADSAKTRTEFSRGEATFFVENGQVRNEDFHVQGLIIQARGSGTASLPAKTLDYTILVQMTGAPTIPVRIHGPFADPAVEVSQREMLTDTVGRLGGSVFSVFKSILTLPFKAVETLQGQ